MLSFINLLVALLAGCAAASYGASSSDNGSTSRSISSRARTTSKPRSTAASATTFKPTGPASSSLEACRTVNASTYYVTQEEPIYTSTITYTTTPTSYEVITSGTTYTETVYSNTRTDLGQTVSTFKIVVSPATTTVTVPTVSGFTPVLCLSTYISRTATVTASTTTVYRSTYYIATASPPVISTTTIYTTEAVVTETLAGTQGTIYYPTETVTSTRADPTSTVYDACATNNVTPSGPNGYLENVSPVNGPTQDDIVTNIVEVGALDATDCCGICQGNSSCSGSAYDIRGFATCRLFILKDTATQTNDPSLPRQGAYGDREQLSLYISNSGHGQFRVSDI